MNNWLIITFTLIFAAFFSGMEIAFVTSNRLKIELDKNKGLFSGKILSRFVKNPSRFIGALLLGSNVAMVIYGIAIAAILEPLLSANLPAGINGDFSILLIQTILSTLVVLFLAEFLPKMLFRLNPNGLLSFFALPAHLLYALLYPLIYLFISISEFLLKKIFKTSIPKQHYQFSAIDLNEYIHDFSSHQGSQNESEHELQMIQNVMDFHLTKLRECMLPRNEIIAINSSDSIEELRELYAKSGHSKILVYNNSIDNIIGYAHLYDLFSYPQSIRSVTRPIIIVPETITANQVLDMFIKQHRSVAVVVDEFGGTAGMVTTEDLIEEIFGEINDEHDTDELEEKQTNEFEFVFSGRHEISYINHEYNIDLPESDEYETLAGLIIHYHHNIPQSQDVVIVEPFTFTILEASETRIEKVQILINKKMA